MTLVHYQVSIFSHHVVYHALLTKTLDNGDINLTRGFALPSTYLSDFFVRNAEKFRYSGNPLVQQLSSVDQHQCVYSSCGYQMACHDGFSEGSCGS